MMIIKNETIKKLTNEEMNNLGCFNIGIGLCKGTPKARIKGLKTTLKTKTEVHYEGEHIRHELIKLADESGDCYAYRLFDKSKNEYEKFILVFQMLAFIK